ncbi:MAG: Uma2 family endonuclease [Planctomycetes bacterium]|nr:Uma2 family endonuclease [Planctomycetota bacterium]
MTPLIPSSPSRKKVVYPESDGELLSDNTLQLKWIFTIFGGLDGWFKNEPNVFVATNLLWYPVEGDNTTRLAPDVLVALGRPQGRRGSYRQWEEGGVPPQVVFEVLSPGKRSGEMVRKFQFYERFGVQEYYVFDPDRFQLEGYSRLNGILTEIPEMDGWVSPLLGIRFDMSGDDLVIFRPDGRHFLPYRDLLEERDAEARLKEEERLARLQAQQRADKAQERADRLAEQLRKLGVEPDER